MVADMSTVLAFLMSTHLINDVPCVYLARPATTRLLDVVRDDTGQSGGTTNVANPVRELGVPHKCMSSVMRLNR
jgi:hypothetical protein